METDYIGALILVVMLTGGAVLIASCFLLVAELPGIICKLLGYGDDDVEE